MRGNGNSILSGSKPGTRSCGYLSAREFGLLRSTPDWSWDPVADDWRNQYDAAVAYFNENGHWPKTTDDRPQVQKLGRWVSTNRKQGKRLAAGAPSDMTAERFSQLNSTAGWSWDPIADAWDQNFEAVRVFRQEHKRLPAFGASGDEGSLAAWVGGQRQARKKGKLSPDRVKRLEALPGWSWSAKR
jgi:hypothetical protein